MVIQAVDRRQRLRQATFASHVRLDALIHRTGLLDSRSRYELYLQATWTARWPIERALETFDVATLYKAWPDRRVCEALSQDVFDLSGVRPAESSAAQPEVSSSAQALGLLYVIEGSALGARILQTQLASIGMTATYGARHLAKQTAQPQAWREFTALLAHIQLDEAAENECVASAVAAFNLFENSFQHLAYSQ